MVGKLWSLMMISMLLFGMITSGCGGGDKISGNTPEVHAQLPAVSVENPQEIFYGQWVIKKNVAHESVGTYGNEDMKKIEGRKLNFSKEKASCFGDDIKYLDDITINPVYKKTNVPKSRFATNHRIAPEVLGINNDDYITEVQVVDSKTNRCIFYIKDNNTLILYGGGVYFELDREM